MSRTSRKRQADRGGEAGDQAVSAESDDCRGAQHQARRGQRDGVRPDPGRAEFPGQCLSGSEGPEAAEWLIRPSPQQLVTRHGQGRGAVESPDHGRFGVATAPDHPAESPWVVETIRAEDHRPFGRRTGPEDERTRILVGHDVRAG